MTPIRWNALLACAAGLAFAQSEGGAKFEIADVHVSPKSQNPFMRSGPPRGGRLEVKTATMVDLIRLAYGFDPDKVLGGPNWLEMDRFDIAAKLPFGSTPETQKEMMRALLEERFQLKTHKETKPLPTYALVVGKKPQIKEADGKEETGCKPMASSPGAGGENRNTLTMMNANGTTTTIALGPGQLVTYQCRNMSMAGFVSNLRTMIGANIGTNPIIDDTGLNGGWNFDFQYSIQFIGPMANNGERVSVSEAIEKQLGLKLEERQVPTPVIVVDSVNRKPTENAPNLAELLPPIPVPTEFEVASVKPSDPNSRMPRMQMQPGGRLIVDGMALHFLINRAFNTNNQEMVADVPKFADSDRYDIVAKTASTISGNAMDMEAMATPLMALLKDRFKMTYHTEDRPVTAYSLAAGKPKMKKADPASRTFCKTAQAPAGSPAGSQMLTCQNISMAQFADRLQGMAPELNWPLVDGTGLEGGWDFTLIYNRFGTMMMGGPGRGGDGAAAPSNVPSASDPSGGYTIFEAIEKQLGLKLEKQKRSLPVIVIDHLEPKPTEN
jgi:uncharacterized protein (TIGR03435 family)